jgi:hypothetical protein
MTTEDLDLARQLRYALTGVEGAPEPPRYAPRGTRDGVSCDLEPCRPGVAEPLWRWRHLVSARNQSFHEQAGRGSWLPDLVDPTWAATLLDLFPGQYVANNLGGTPNEEAVRVRLDVGPYPGDESYVSSGPTLTIAAARAFVAWRDHAETLVPEPTVMSRGEPSPPWASPSPTASTPLPTHRRRGRCASGRVAPSSRSTSRPR